MSIAAPRTGPRLRRSRPAWARAAWAVLMTLALLLVAIVAVVTIGALVPGLGLLSVVGNLVAPTLSPQLVLVGLVVAVIGVVARRRGLRRSGATAAALGVGGLVANVVVVGVLVDAVQQNGGSVDLVRATFGLSAMDSPAPDQVRTYDRTAAGEELALDIFEPTAPPTGERVPAVLYVHGGGWSSGTGTTTAADHRALADAGYLVASVNYQLSTESTPSWDAAPAQVGCAAVWLSDHADDLGVDVDRLTFWGDSAGGNLALNAAYAAATGTAPSSCGGTVPVPAAVVADYPAADMRGVAASGFALGALAAGPLAEQYIGGTAEEYPERYDGVSTATYLSPEAPPTLIIEPMRDTLVPTRTVLDFAEQARSAGVEVEVAQIPLSWHIYTQLAAGSIGNQAHLSIGTAYLAERLG
jgi:acetyl esterase